MHTLTTDQLAELLQQSAAGYYPAEAAARLLCEHRIWLERADFLAACVDYDHDGTTPVAWVEWPAVPGFLDRASCSSSEDRILRLAAELAGVDTGQPLVELLTSLDDHNARRVVDAIAHALHRGAPAAGVTAAAVELITVLHEVDFDRRSYTWGHIAPAIDDLAVALGLRGRR
jgi:hypothetical protein